jgi:hypothetical protein
MDTRNSHAMTNPDIYGGYDHVSRPAHYDMPIQPREYIMTNGLSYCMGNIVKYASRAGKKQYGNMSMLDSELIDLRKIQEYAEYQIEAINELKLELEVDKMNGF